MIARVCLVTKPASPSYVFPNARPMTSPLKLCPGEYSPMHTPTTSTPSQSTVTTVCISQPMTSGSTSGTWSGRNRASVSISPLLCWCVCWCVCVCVRVRVSAAMCRGAAIVPLPVFLWCTTNVPELPSDIVDIKPPNMEDLTEVITAAEFHPRNCSDFLYSTSKGVVRLCDMRERALCDQHAKGMYLSARVHWAAQHSLCHFPHCLPSLHPPLLTLSALTTPSPPHIVCPHYTLPSSHCLPSLCHLCSV